MAYLERNNMDQITTNQRYTTATRLEERVRSLKFEVGRSFLDLGKTLKEIRDNDYYKELGYESILEWLSSPEISLSATWCWNLIAIYELFIVEHKLSPENVLSVDYSKLTEIAPVIKREPDKLEEWLDKARVLRRIDLRREIKEHNVQKKEDEYIPPARDDSNVILGESLAELQQLEDESVDLVIADPPHFIPKSEYAIRRDDVGEPAPDYGWIVDYHRMWLLEAVRVLKKEGAMFLFGNLHSIFPLGHVVREMGLYIIRDIVWIKPNNQKPVTLTNYVQAHELIIWARKGVRHTANITDIERDVWEIPNNYPYEHPSEKPDLLMEKLITVGSKPGDTVLDPFAGSGTSLVVAKRLKRRYIGIEQDKHWHKIITERLTTYE